MDKSEWTALKSALKTLDAGPKKIAQARAEYAEADRFMRDPVNSRRYSEIGKENFYKTAQAQRDTVIKGEVAKITKALEVAREYRAYPRESIDLSSVKLMNALTVINMLKGKMRPDEQLSIAEQFRGDPAALRFLSDVYKQNGLYYAPYLADMARPIGTEELDNLQYCCDSYEQLGTWPEEKLTWTQHAFEEAADRLGFNMTDGRDAYVEALKAARQGQPPEVQRILSDAIIQIQRGAEYMTDEQKAQLFNDATAKINALADEKEAAEITRQANTQEALDLISNEGGAE